MLIQESWNFCLQCFNVLIVGWRETASRARLTPSHRPLLYSGSDLDLPGVVVRAEAGGSLLSCLVLIVNANNLQVNNRLVLKVLSNRWRKITCNKGKESTTSLSLDQLREQRKFWAESGPTDNCPGFSTHQRRFLSNSNSAKAKGAACSK